VAVHRLAERRRYALFDMIATGGMASVYFGRLETAAGFSRVVAIKKLHPQLARDPAFAAMLLDEARMASRIRHANVIATLDVVEDGSELLLVMEYVAGEALSRLIDAASEANESVPIEVAVAIAAGVLHGLHAAHEATTEAGEPLGLVHRDVSPQNVLVGSDGVPRLLDFGVAKASGRCQITREGVLKGKLPYMAPEQLRGEELTRQCDVWGAAALAWELLTCRILFDGDTDAHVFGQILSGKIEPPSSVDESIPAELDRVVLTGLARSQAQRYRTAREMALALEACVRPATAAEVGVWVRRLAGPVLAERAVALSAVERDLRSGIASKPATPGTDDGTETLRLAQLDDTVAASIRASAGTGAHTSRRSETHRVVRGLSWAAGGAAASLMIVSALSARGDHRPDALMRAVERTARAASALVANAGVGAATATDAAEVPAAPAASAPAEPTAAKRSPVRAPTTKKRPPEKATSAKPGQRREECYTLDASGVWHVRPECL
jgi:serine/threonine-protein kinase